MHPAELKKLVSCIDLTSLNNKTDIHELCEKAMTPLGSVAAVCIYPEFVSKTWALLMNTPIKIATVVNFPYGDESRNKINKTIQQAILDGASEIDMVIPHSNPAETIKYSKILCGDKAILKIILETGKLFPIQIQKLSEIAIENGADFIKTSTGKKNIGATPEAARIILEVIKDSQKSVGFKASGGIRTLEQARIYINLVKEILGENAFNPKQFRMGASTLLENIFLCESQNQN
jgi:deoxyribose-phosphate aldolase